MNAPYQHAPYDIDLEQAVLGAILADNATVERLGGSLRADHFYDPLHGRMFETMLRMAELDGVEVTPITLHAEMKADPGLIEVKGLSYLQALQDCAPSVSSKKGLADRLIELWTRRSIIHIAEGMIAGAHEPPAEYPASKQIENAERELYSIADVQKFGAGAKDFEEAIRFTIEQAQLAAARGSKISGLPSGFADIDNLLGGLQPSDLLILAGRPGMGKTALGTNMAFHVARSMMLDVEDGVENPSGTPVLFFSLEMAAHQISARILSEQTEIEMWKIRNGRFAQPEWDKFALRSGELSRLPLYIDDSGGISIAQIAARARRMKREKGIGLIIIDYLQLVESSRRHENRVQEITEVTKGLKTLAKELNVPVLALSQLSRGVDSREDKRPVLSDLRESGSIEQDADVVMFVYREEYYLKTREPDVSSPEYAKWDEKMQRAKSRAEVLVEKHRHGATGVIDLYFDDRFTRFSNLSE